MQHDLEAQIRERAYQLWLSNGCPDGESDRHWLRAERELLAGVAASMSSAVAKPARRPAKAATKTAGKAKRAA